VEISIEKNPQTEHALVTVDIIEGPPTVWGTIVTRGDDPVLAGKTYHWIKLLERGKPASPRQLQRTLTLCQGTYADFGHPYAKYSAVWDIDSTQWDTANIAITVDPGPMVRFGLVDVVGNTYTKSDVIYRELSFKPGDLYSRREILESQNNIYRTGLFTFTRLQVSTDTAAAEITSSDAAPNFDLKVVERKPSYIGFSTGAGQDEQQDLTWDYSLEWGTRNWFGTGRSWALQVKSAFIVVTDWRVLSHRFAAQYTEPWIFGVRLPTTIQIAYEPGVRSVVQPYRIERIEGELGVQARIGETKKAWLSLVYENVNIFGLNRPIEEFRQEEGITIRRKIVFAFEKDSRPNIFIPASGSLSRIDAEFAGGFLGGDVDFYKIVGSWARYQTYAASVVATRLKFGWVKSHSGGGPVPSVDRFYLGGANSIRGYQENRVGPMNDDTPEGGGVIGVANAEIRTPVIWKFWFTVFGDLGNNWATFSDIVPDDILLSMGIGLQYVSPVGPLRLDYAKRLVHPGHPASDRVHLAILFAY